MKSEKLKIQVCPFNDGSIDKKTIMYFSFFTFHFSLTKLSYAGNMYEL